MIDVIRQVIADTIQENKKGPVKWCNKCSRYHAGANSRCNQAKVIER